MLRISFVTGGKINFMNFNPSFAILGLSGGELIVIMFSLLLVFLIVCFTIWAILRLLIKRKKTTPPPPSVSPTPNFPPTPPESPVPPKGPVVASQNAAPPILESAPKHACRQCGTPLPPDAPQGLCPACLLKVGIGSQISEPGTPVKPHAPAPAAAEIAKFFPQFEIIELLGQGGMGMVYKARQPQLDRFVALKILAPELSSDPAFAERFSREAKTLAKLNHPNIVSVYDFGQVGNLYYLIMEYVDGLNLMQMEQSQKRLKPEEALAIVPKICEALQYAHDEGFVHRDIKPANILIDSKGRVKIADFGLAKLLGHERIAGLSLTASRAMMGTPQYMAPEQVEKPLTVDHRADIYSLGVVFYEMLTGELPLGRFSPPSARAALDVRLDEVVLKTLEKEPERRYQHVSEVEQQVKTIIETPPTQISKAPEPSKTSEAFQNAPSKTEHKTTSAPSSESAPSQIPQSPTTSTSHSETQASVEHDFALKKMANPALALMALGLLNLVFYTPTMIVCLFWGKMPYSSQLVEPISFFWQISPLIAFTSFLGIVASLITIFAGIKAKSLQAYPLVICGAVLAAIFTPFCFVGVAVAIWILGILTTPQVRNVFKDPAESIILANNNRPKEDFFLNIDTYWVLGGVAIAMIVSASTNHWALAFFLGTLYLFGKILCSLRAIRTSPSEAISQANLKSIHSHVTGLAALFAIGIVLLGVMVFDPSSIGSHREPQPEPAQPVSKEIQHRYALGPTIESTLLEASTNTHNCCLNLKTGQTLDLPATNVISDSDTSASNENAEDEQLKKLNIDVIAKGTNALFFRKAALRKIDNGQFDSGTSPIPLPENVSVPFGSPTIIPNTIPATYSFIMENGLRGILQFAETTQNPRGIKLRYRLIQAEADGE